MDKRAINKRFAECVEYVLQHDSSATKGAISENMGVKPNTFSEILKFRMNIATDHIANFIVSYPYISAEWVLTGRGNIIVKEEDASEIIVHKIHKPPYREKLTDIEVPLYNIDAAANLRTLFDNKNQNIIDKIKIPDLPKCDGAIYIRGDSMYPLLKSGDIVIYKETIDFNHIIFGEIYLVDYSIYGDDYLVCKYVKRSHIEGYIQLVSYNQHHDPLDIPVEGCVRAMAIVKASVRLNMII